MLFIHNDQKNQMCYRHWSFLVLLTQILMTTVESMEPTSYLFQDNDEPLKTELGLLSSPHKDVLVRYLGSSTTHPLENILGSPYSVGYGVESQGSFPYFFRPDVKRRLGSEFVGKRSINSEGNSKLALLNDNGQDGNEFLGFMKRRMGSEFLGKRRMGSEFLGKRRMGSEFLGKRRMGSEFLGKRRMGSEFLGKRTNYPEFDDFEIHHAESM